MTVSAVEFIRRFMLHIMPKGFVRIRHYGFLSNRTQNKSLPLCRKAIESIITTTQLNGKLNEVIEQITGKYPAICPICGKGKMIECENIPPPVIMLKAA